MTEGYFVRHGLTKWNLEGRIIGQSDPPLNSAGRVQAARLARRLEHVNVEIVYSSPLARAVETARLIAAAKNCQDVTRHELIEASYGSLEGKLKTQPDVTDVWQARERDKYGFKPPGGECYLELESRITEFVASVTGGPLYVAVTHVGVIRVLLALFGGLPRQEAGGVSPGHEQIWQLGGVGAPTAVLRGAEI